jgi:hypothetical protein
VAAATTGTISYRDISESMPTTASSPISIAQSTCRTATGQSRLAPAPVRCHRAGSYANRTPNLNTVWWNALHARPTSGRNGAMGAYTSEMVKMSMALVSMSA